VVAVRTGVHELQDLSPPVVVGGEPWTTLPEDLYIPPAALQLVLESFSGPFDLLWYLIRRHNIDILDIPIAQVTRQYLAYIDLMHELRIELAAEYLLMAAVLAEIKSRMLLPRPPSAAGGDEGEEDPRAELVRRLRAYEVIRRAALALDEHPRLERDLWTVEAGVPDEARRRPPPTVALSALVAAMAALLAENRLRARHRVRRELLSVRARMSLLLERLEGGEARRLEELVDPAEGRPGLVVTFLAILELVHEGALEIVQRELYGSVYLRLPDPDRESATIVGNLVS
jgi:segregation and condensation protein A